MRYSHSVLDQSLSKLPNSPGSCVDWRSRLLHEFYPHAYSPAPTSHPYLYTRLHLPNLDGHDSINKDKESSYSSEKYRPPQYKRCGGTTAKFTAGKHHPRFLHPARDPNLPLLGSQILVPVGVGHPPRGWSNSRCNIRVYHHPPSAWSDGSSRCINTDRSVIARSVCLW